MPGRRRAREVGAGPASLPMALDSHPRWWDSPETGGGLNQANFPFSLLETRVSCSRSPNTPGDKELATPQNSLRRPEFFSEKPFVRTQELLLGDFPIIHPSSTVWRQRERTHSLLPGCSQHPTLLHLSCPKALC